MIFFKIFACSFLCTSRLKGPDYKSVFDLAQRLNLLSKDFTLISKRQSISYKALKTKTNGIFKKLDSAFELFIKLLEPVALEIEQLNDLF